MSPTTALPPRSRLAGGRARVLGVGCPRELISWTAPVSEIERPDMIVALGLDVIDSGDLLGAPSARTLSEAIAAMEERIDIVLVAGHDAGVDMVTEVIDTLTERGIAAGVLCEPSLVTGPDDVDRLERASRASGVVVDFGYDHEHLVGPIAEIVRSLGDPSVEMVARPAAGLVACGHGPGEARTGRDIAGLRVDMLGFASRITSRRLPLTVSTLGSHRVGELVSPGRPRTRRPAVRLQWPGQMRASVSVGVDRDDEHWAIAAVGLGGEIRLRQQGPDGRELLPALGEVLGKAFALGALPGVAEMRAQRLAELAAAARGVQIARPRTSLGFDLVRNDARLWAAARESARQGGSKIEP